MIIFILVSTLLLLLLLFLMNHINIFLHDLDYNFIHEIVFFLTFSEAYMKFFNFSFYCAKKSAIASGKIIRMNVKLIVDEELHPSLSEQQLNDELQIVALNPQPLTIAICLLLTAIFKIFD